MAKTAESDATLKERTESLEDENKKLKKKIERLKKTMEIATKHNDKMTVELEEKVQATEQQLITTLKLLPVPVVISMAKGGQFLYANQNACATFRSSSEDFLKQRAPDLYANQEDRARFLDALSEKEQVADFEIELKRSDDSRFWASLFFQQIVFKDEVCLLTVIYDLTERRKAEDEIRRLKSQLEQKTVKYLMFTLDGAKYGIELVKVREIIKITPITPVINAPPYVKGVINLRGKLIPVTDLRLRLGLKAEAYTDRTCIIITDAGEKGTGTVTGFIVDTVADVQGVRNRDIEPPPALMLKKGAELISGIAKIENGVIILIEYKQVDVRYGIRGTK